jgi:hypothetical protein
MTVEKWLADDVYRGDKFDRAAAFSEYLPLAEGLQREVAWYKTPLSR